MEKFVIEGGHPLNGEVTPSGNKNAALPILAACILTDQPVILHNIPNIRDTRTMLSLLESLGATIENINPNSWKIHAREVRSADLDPELCKQVRTSILFAGPMTASGRSTAARPA